MAEEVVIKVAVDAEPARKSVKGLKGDLKELIDQQANVAKGGKLWKALAKEINEVEGEIGDLTDSFKTLTGSGVDRVNASVGLLKEGFASFDMGKIGVGLKGLGSAFKSVLPFALIEGIMYLVENFEELSKGSGFLAKSLRFVGDIIDAIGDKINWLTDKLGLTNTALDEQGEKITENAEKNQEALNETVAAYDRQIKAAQAAGKSTVELEKAKQQAIINTNRLIAEQIANFVRAGGELDDEKKKQLTAALNTIKNAVNEQQVIEIKATEDAKKRNEEAYKKKKELIDKSKEDADRLFDELSKQQDAADQREADARAKEKSDREKNLNELRELRIKAEQQEVKDFEESEAALKAIRDKSVSDAKASREAAAAESINIAKGVSDVFTQLEQNKLTTETNRINAALQNDKLTAAEKYALQKQLYEKEREFKRKQFDTDKAFRVAQATQDGIAASMKALAQFGGVPTGIPFAVATGALAAANIAKILATKFDGGVAPVMGSETSSSVSVPTTSAPTVNTTAPTTQASTTFDEQGRNNNFNRVYVVESDISRVQGRVAKIAEQATI